MMVPSSIRKETKVSIDKSRGPKQPYRPHKERIGSFSIKREDPDKLRYKKYNLHFI